MLRAQRMAQLQKELLTRLDYFDVALHEGNAIAAVAQSMAISSAARSLALVANENARRP